MVFYNEAEAKSYIESHPLVDTSFKYRIVVVDYPDTEFDKYGMYHRMFDVVVVGTVDGDAEYERDN